MTTPTLGRPTTAPALGAPHVVAPPESSERRLANGLRVAVVRRPGVPLVELRLHIPFAGTSERHHAAAEVLAETVFTGTAHHDRAGLAAAVQALGGAVAAGVDADRLVVSGSSLAPALPEFLGLVAEALQEATFPEEEVAGEIGRLVQELQIARSQPGLLAREALLSRMYGDHPYGRDLPDPDVLRTVTPAELRDLHARRVAPDEATLVLVGDIDPDGALAAAEEALTGWRGTAVGEQLPPLPEHRPGPVVLVDRPGAVQTNIRLGGPALPRTHPDFPALQLANVIYGGYFTSRLVANIREDKGYTYSPRSGLDHPRAGSRFTVAADVATEVTAAALLEISYELGRMVTSTVTAEELEAARQYAIGTLALSTATQAGLASTLAALLPQGLGVAYLTAAPLALAAVTAEQVQRVSERFLAPSGLVTVLLGDRAVIAEPVARLRPIETA
ncbi:MAG: hypothetical protein JWM48_3123 [Mycobacterium sp.]|nr:hypothetical protein [Mycobacterium sp.]